MMPSPHAVKMTRIRPRTATTPPVAPVAYPDIYRTTAQPPLVPASLAVSPGGVRKPPVPARSDSGLLAVTDTGLLTAQTRQPATPSYIDLISESPAISRSPSEAGSTLTLLASGVDLQPTTSSLSVNTDPGVMSPPLLSPAVQSTGDDHKTTRPSGDINYTPTSRTTVTPPDVISTPLRSTPTTLPPGGDQTCETLPDCPDVSPVDCNRLDVPRRGRSSTPPPLPPLPEAMLLTSLNDRYNLKNIGLHIQYCDHAF